MFLRIFLLTAPLLMAALSLLYIKRRRARRTGSAH